MVQAPLIVKFDYWPLTQVRTLYAWPKFGCPKFKLELNWWLVRDWYESKILIADLLTLTVDTQCQCGYNYVHFSSGSSGNEELQQNHQVPDIGYPLLYTTTPSIPSEISNLLQKQIMPHHTILTSSFFTTYGYVSQSKRFYSFKLSFCFMAMTGRSPSNKPQHKDDEQHLSNDDVIDTQKEKHLSKFLTNCKTK